jgi:hypothetical protein
MFKRNQINLAVVVAALTVGSSVAIAQETADVSASVTVQNAFNLSQTTALSFGVLRVTQTASSATGTAPSVTINADGSAPSVSAAVSPAAGSISVITPGTAGVFAISSAAPDTALTVTLPASVALTASGTSNEFQLDFTDTDDIQVVGGPNDGNTYTGFNLVTDDTGAIGFNLGGTLSTRIGDLTYIDTTYSGDYTVTVSY